MIQDSDDLPSADLQGAQAGRDAIEATNPVLVEGQTETFKALLREAIGIGSSVPRRRAKKLQAMG